MIVLLGIAGMAFPISDKDHTSKYIGFLKYVPGGTFKIDSVTITVSTFRMSEKEITRAQFAAVTGLTDPSNKEHSTGQQDPVQCVNWYHALVFCNKLSMLEGLTPVYNVNDSTDPERWGKVPNERNISWDAAKADRSANGYRLPTEMEWMWAAMGADSDGLGKVNMTGYNKAFAGSSGSNTIDDYAWTRENSSNNTYPVGTKKPNELGLFDMSGNVWEWCWDWHTNEYPKGAMTNYSGAATGERRVLRGGSWYRDASCASIAYRVSDSPYYQDDFVGFRVVRP